MGVCGVLVLSKETKEKWLDFGYRALAVMSFVSLCWVLSRSVDERPLCLHSEFVAELVNSGDSFDNCRAESRLSLNNLAHTPTQESINLARRLDTLDSLSSVWPKPLPAIHVVIDTDEPFLFEMSQGQVRVGAAIAQAQGQLERAIVLSLLNSHFSPLTRTAFENEVTADFLLMNVLGIRELQDPSTGEIVSFDKNVSFAFSERSLDEYCNSFWRSLSHFMICSIQNPGFRAHDISSWGSRPLVAKILSDFYDQLGMSQKVQLISGLFESKALASVTTLKDSSSQSLALWTVEQARSILTGWGFSPDDASVKFPFQRALVLSRVFQPTQWDYTVEFKNTPEWESLWLSLKQWSQAHPDLNILVWSPIGIHAFPEGNAVRWAASDVKTQKHFLIACKWPQAKDAIAIEARHFVALQVCDKSQSPKWNEILTPTSEQVSN
jgi:hypothetical protein